MKTAIILIWLALFVFSVPSVGQTHAPLPQQCVADANLWFHANKEALDKLPFTEQGQRTQRFIERNGLGKQFLKEDEAGLR